MDVYTDFARTYEWDPVRNLHFDELESTRDDVDLYIGMRHQKPINSDKINVFIDFEQPNTWYGGPEDEPFGHALSRERTFDKIFSIHEPVVIKRNQILATERYGYCFFPFNLKHEPKEKEKEYDLFFSGHWYGDNYCLQREVIGPAIESLKTEIENFNFFAVSGYNAWGTNGRDLSYDDKLRENSKSRISIAYNHQETSPRFHDNIPMLQREYEKDDLVSKVIDISENYHSDKYQNIIKAGYEHTKNEHNTQQFYNKYIKDL